jgi:hypothetical protein
VRRLPGTHLLIQPLLIAALIVGSFDLHPHAEHPVPVDPDVPVLSGASHPHEAPHVEDAGQAVTVRCPACLLHLQSQASTGQTSPGTVLPAPSGTARVGNPPTLLDAVRLSGGSRAPPSV